MRVRVHRVNNSSPLTVRDAPGGNEIGRVSMGATGTIVDHPNNGKSASARGETHIWMCVRFDGGPTGFVAQEHLHSEGGGSSTPRESNTAARAAARATSIFPSMSSGVGAGGAGCSGLLVLLVVAAGIYWFVTVVLPTLLKIAAVIAGLAIVFVTVRACVRRFGWGPTLLGAAAAIGVPLLIAGYIAKFTGDLEADHDFEAFNEPLLSAESCGPKIGEGDNLDFVDGDEPVRDTLVGRFAHVSVHDTPCWVRMSDVHYQRGLFMSIVGLVVPLGDAHVDDVAARHAALVALDAEVTQATAAGDEAKLAQAAERVRREGAMIFESTAARLETVEAKVAFRQVLDDYPRAPDFMRRTLYAFGMGLPAPADKQPLERAHQDWRRTRCASLAQNPVLTGADAAAAADYLLSVAAGCAGAYEPFSAALEDVATRLESAALGAPESAVMALRTLARAYPDHERVASATTAALGALRATRLRIATGRVSGVAPAAVLSARLELSGDPELPPIADRDLARLRQVATAAARRGVDDFLRARARHDGRHRVEHAAVLAPFGMAESDLPSALGEATAPWRVAQVDPDDTLSRAEVSLVSRRSREQIRASMGFCFHGSSGRWFVCPRSSRTVNP